MSKLRRKERREREGGGRQEIFEKEIKEEGGEDQKIRENLERQLMRAESKLNKKRRRV